MFAGIGTTTFNHGLFFFHNTGVGNTHSLQTNHNGIISGDVSRNLVTVSTAASHGLVRGNTAFVDVNPSISTTQTIRYNSFNRKMVVGSLPFAAAGVAVTTNTLNISEHGLSTGQKVIHSSASPATGLTDNKELCICG